METDKYDNFLQNIAFIMRGTVISFVSDKTMENGLGEIRYYNIHIEKIDEDTKSVNIIINSNIPDVGIYPPIVEYAKEIGYDVFNTMLKEKVEKTMNTYKKSKDIQFNYSIDIDIHEFNIEVTTVFEIPSDIIEVENDIPDKIDVIDKVDIPQMFSLSTLSRAP